MERERASDSLRLREREHIAWSVRSYKGLSAAGWLVVRIEKYMTDFLVNYPKWESRKCCLSLSHADKHISHCIFFLPPHIHAPSAMGAHSSLSVSLSSHPNSFTPTHTPTHTHKNFQSHTSQAPTLGEWVWMKKKHPAFQSVWKPDRCPCVCLCV